MRKIFTGLTCKLLLGFTVISGDAYRSCIWNKTIFINYISHSVEIHRVRQYLVNVTGLTGRINSIVYNTEKIFLIFNITLMRWIDGYLRSLHWRHNDHDSVSNHQPHGCLLNRLFRRRSKQTSKLRVTGLCVGNSPGPVNSPHKGPVTRKMVPFDDVIMWRHDRGTVTSGSPHNKCPMMRNFGVFSVVSMNGVFNKQPNRRWFETKLSIITSL